MKKERTEILAKYRSSTLTQINNIKSELLDVVKNKSSESIEQLIGAITNKRDELILLEGTLKDCYAKFS